MSLKQTSFLVIILLASVCCRSQKGVVQGFINDADSRTPITGASINISNVFKGDNTDQFGMFRLTSIAAGRYELVASHIGYKTEIIEVEVREHLISSVTINMKRSELNLSEVKINGKKSSSLNTTGALDIMLRPVNNSQDVLRIVPGLFIAQHAGGGKAEQIFLRGYDTDHGTDINITVDGIPVNMVSHAHGQGYADLHFLIPETVEKVSFDKGPYNAAKGNLATAAYVDFATREFIDKNSIKLEYGDFNSKRAVAIMRLFNKQTEKKRRQLYIASEYSATDGYFESPQDFHRLNIMGKYNAWLGNQSQLTVTASVFNSRWNASGQVPDRAVHNGIISRFGAIDDSEGGSTGRINFIIKYNRQWKNNWKTTDQFYYSHYRFNLYSNFTFFLEDPVNGDMINQRESRNILGYTTTAARSWFTGNVKINSQLGAGFRHDDINDISLSRAVKRQFLSLIQSGDIKETNSFIYTGNDIELNDRLSIHAGLRYDHFRFAYKNKLTGETAFRYRNKSTISPKLNFTWVINPRFKLFLNNGIGFHSNDSRVILNNSTDDILPKVRGTDLGFITKPVKNLLIKTALWHLYSEQEFVYVGDAGVVEPGGRTRRTGIDISARYQLNRWLYADIDVNLTKARSAEAIKGADYIPLAPSFTSIGGLTARNKNGFSGSFRYRFIGSRPADEFNSIKAKGYFISDMMLGYSWKRIDINVSAENIFNIDWREAQFNTESRLKFETDPVTEIHYTPGSPRYIKASISLRF